MTEWEKVPKAPYYVEIWEGPYRTSYRVNFRAHGLSLRQNLDESFADKPLREIIAEADRLISLKRFGEKDPIKDKIEAGEKEKVRTEDVLKKLLVESEANDRKSTRALKTNIIEKHMIPWLNDHYPFAESLTVETWPAYKVFKRRERADVALYNHSARFRTLFKRVFELHLIPHPIRLKFNVKREDFTEKGNVIPDAHLAQMIAAATPKHFGKIARIMPKWRDRIILQRRTGMRPGEVRNLEKRDVELCDGYARIHIPAEKEKRWGERHFRVRDPECLEILRRRLERIEGPYLFPNGKRVGLPMDKSLRGWQAVLRRAFDPKGEGCPIPPYTPHDLRHTYATDMFKKTKQSAQLCFQLGMSLEVAQDVYLHLSEADTDELAALAASDRGGL